MRLRGFTLLELTLVLLIVSVVMGIMAPSLGKFLDTRKTVNAANELIALARHGRSQAISEGRTYRLNVDAQTLAYWLEVQRGAAFTAADDEPGQRHALPDGTTLEWKRAEGAPANAYVVFHPDGRSEAATLTLIRGRTNERVELGALSEGEAWRIMKEDER